MQFTDLVKQVVKKYAFCVHCGEPARMGLGQLVFFHRDCRKAGRRQLNKTRRANRAEEVRLHNEEFDSVK